MNKMGIIFAGGLNPVACVQEAGIIVESRAMSAVMRYGDLAPFSEIYKKYTK